ncbi:MAG TPA: PQQ-dependent sugar dehydrogenase [Chitinophagaceae bacterium]|nr:PQQ-dependent sugar dehydrogenase [Chitinophagaceae bacterium]
MKNNGLFIIMLLVTIGCSAQQTGGNNLPSIPVKAALIAEGLQAPTDMAFPAAGTIWLTEQTGKIKIIKNGHVTGVLLDVNDKMVDINNGYDERGLLGIALHPSFATNKKFYVFYSAPSAGRYDNMGVLAEYTFLPNTDKADVNSARIILTVDEPESNHNGGCIKFGPDGYLYLGLGDGGGAGDRHGGNGNGQNLGTWLGKILRIDVNDGKTYKLPADNPFMHTPGAKPEIWAYGLRNPYRFSFDRTGRLFAGDVGQNQWEEVDIIQKGANYGWRITEGTHCYNPSSGCDTKGIAMPITEFSHREGASVIGGVIYNGIHLQSLKNHYVFADWTGPVFYLAEISGVWQRGKLDVQNYPSNLKITGFGEDAAGELYWLTNTDTGPGGTGGAIYKMDAPQ